MRRFPLAIFVLFFGMPALFGAPKPPELTEKQKAEKAKAAWEAKRKEVADYPYMVVGYNKDEKAWMTCVFTDPKLVRYDWRKKEVDLWAKDEKDSARELTKQKADNKAITATALVDLVGSKDPVAILWFSKQGDVMRRSNAPPSPELAAGLKEYLMFIQANPSLVKVPEQ